MTGSPTIAFVYGAPSSFVRGDLGILRDRFDVIACPWEGKRSIPSILSAVRSADLTFAWFANDHAGVAVTASRLVGTPSIVVVGGSDVAYVPELDYGRFTRSPRQTVPTRIALRHADLLLAVSEFTREETLERVEPRRIEVVPNGVDVDAFRPAETTERVAVTVAPAVPGRVRLKGLETVAEASRRADDVDFVLIGRLDAGVRDRLQRIGPDLEMTGWLDHEEVRDRLGRAAVVCQPSYRESFGLAVAEGMASGCVPVVTERGALPEVAGDVGRYVPYGDAEAVARTVEEAADAPASAGQAARERIVERFSLARRAERVADCVHETVRKA